MERDTPARSVKGLMHCAGRWLVAAAFVSTGHASAATGQIHMKAQHRAMPPQSMDSALPCAACQLAPAFESDTTGSSDHPEHIASASWARPQDEPRDSQQYMLADVIQPSIALRVRYCRWLNWRAPN